MEVSAGNISWEHCSTYLCHICPMVHILVQASNSSGFIRHLLLNLSARRLHILQLCNQLPPCHICPQIYHMNLHQDMAFRHRFALMARQTKTRVPPRSQLRRQRVLRRLRARFCVVLTVWVLGLDSCFIQCCEYLQVPRLCYILALHGITVFCKLSIPPRCSQAAAVLPLTHTEEEEEEEGFYKLRPANKTDHLCQSWQ